MDDDTQMRITEHRRICRLLAELDDDVADDDPRQLSLDQAKDALTWSFIDRPAWTEAGAAAILLYADEYIAPGRDWPDNRGYHDDGGPDLEWPRALFRAVGGALAAEVRRRR